MPRFAFLLCLFALTACNKGAPAKHSVQEVAGSSAERVAAVSSILARHKAPPTAILDAHFTQEQTGDGVLGPSDFRSFYGIVVAPQHVAQWTQLLTPLGGKAEYAMPKEPGDWWIERGSFEALQFYKPDTLTGRVHGWIGIAPQTGRIYIFTFTM